MYFGSLEQGLDCGGEAGSLPARRAYSSCPDGASACHVLSLRRMLHEASWCRAGHGNLGMLRVGCCEAAGSRIGCSVLRRVRSSHTWRYWSLHRGCRLTLEIRLRSVEVRIRSGCQLASARTVGRAPGVGKSAHVGLRRSLRGVARVTKHGATVRALSHLRRTLPMV